MVSCFISRIVILLFGTLYPAYASYKAVRTKNVKEYVKWMMYWIVFALFTSIETFTDLFLSFWFPFYYELKIITVIYLLSPATNGSSILYRKFVHPVLAKREPEIDEYIAKAKEQGYHTMLNLGSKGVTYATSLIMQTAIKGGGGLVSQLKKSYSLGDLSDDSSSNHGGNGRDLVDYRHYEDRRGRRISGAYDQGLYFPEVDVARQRPLHPMTDEEYYGRFPSEEERSSGYSSTDPLYHGFQSSGDPLVRTASLGGSSRIRTRASTRAALPKRSSLTEDGPTRSSGEFNESQSETDELFFIPFTHSSSLPVSFAAIDQLIAPEYRQMVSGFSQEQLIAFINASKPPLSEKSEKVVETKVPVVELSTPDEIDRDDKKETNQINENSLKVEESTDVEKASAAVKKRSKSTGCKESGEKGKTMDEKSGRYNKRSAPSPPANTNTSKPETSQSADMEEAEEFVTPNSSPKTRRKLGASSIGNLVEETNGERKIEENVYVEMPKSPKGKSSKKLHLPKMSFSFWTNHKGGKLSSGSENSSVASSENIAAAAAAAPEKPELEFFIPLKGEPEVKNRPKESFL